MKKADWFIAATFIVMGLSCLFMSMSFIDHSEAVHLWIMRIADYCLWIGLPLIFAGLLYYWIAKRRKG